MSLNLLQLYFLWCEMGITQATLRFVARNKLYELHKLRSTILEHSNYSIHIFCLSLGL